jgi:hypothetical protein
MGTAMIAPGVHMDMPAEVYHDLDAVNRGQVVQFHKDPAEWAAGKEQMDGDALRFGRAVHEAVLEPEAYAPVVVDIKGTSTKTFKEALAEHAGQLVVTEDEFDQIGHIARAVREHEGADFLLSGGKPEVSYVWDDADTGLRCKCRLDYRGSGYAVDLKTTGKPVDEFRRAVYSYHYDVQAAFYLDGANELEELPLETFYFIAVQKPPRYGDLGRWKRILQLGGGVRLFKMTPETIAQGRDIYRAALRGIADIKRNPVENYADNTVHELHCIRSYA